MPDVFDQAATDVFDEAAKDVFDQAAESERPEGELSSRFLASAAEGGLNALTMAARVGGSLNPLTKVGDFLAEKTGIGLSSTDVVQELEGAAQRSRDDYGVDPKFDKGLLSAVASGAGSLVPILASGGTLAPLTGAAMAGEQGLQEAEQAGATGLEKVVTATGNAGLAFASEKLLGLPALLKSVKAAKMPTDTFKGLVKSVMAQVGKSFFREGTQETLEQVGSDIIAKHIAAYDPDRQILDPDKLGTTFLAGGLVGGGLGGVTQLAQDVAPKEQMQEMAESIDQSLAQTLEAEPPPISEVTPSVRATPQGTPILSPEEIQAVPEAQPGEVPLETTGELPTADQVANELQQYRNQAIAAAKASGATDPELAASIAQTELSKQVASGQTRLSDPKSLFISAAENQGSKQARGEQAQKRGGGKVISGDIEGETGTTAIEEAKTDVGPRAEMVAKESAQSIQDVVNSMPENDQKVMRAFMEDASLTIDEISEQTGLTVDQVKKAKSRATKALAQFVKNQGMGERMAPGASNIRELRNARYTLASDIYEGLRQSGKLTRETFEKNVEGQYPELFTKEDFDDLWTVSQMASEQSQESKGRKPMGKIIDDLTGAVTGEGQTSLRNKQTDIERRKRGLPAAMETARRSHPVVWDEAMRRMDENKQLQDETLTKFRNNPSMVPEDWENAILLHAQIEAENNFDRAVDDVNNAYDKGDEQGKLEAMSRAREAETKLVDTYEIERSAGTAAGRSLSSRRLTSGRDYTLGRMVAETRASKGGKPLTEAEQKQVSDEYEGIKKTNAELEERVAQLEEEKARKAYEDTIEEMGTPEDPVTKSLVQRIVERLNSAADAARKRILGRLQRASGGLDPTLLYDLAVIGASKIANGLTRKSKWRSSMESEFGEDIPEIKDSMDEIWEESNRMMDQAIEKVAPKNEKVKQKIKNPTNQQIVDSTIEKMGARIKAGDPVEKLRAYIQKLALALVRSGVTKPDPLLDTVFSLVEPMNKGITKREVMDLISGYGDFSELDPEKAKVELRDIKGQLQQRAKLEDIKAKRPLQMTGLERRKKSDEERRLEKEVNDAKKKYGVVVTDPARQLKSTLDSIKTRVSNEIRDLTHQIETGEDPIPGTPAPTSEEIEKLKAIRDNLRKFLKDTDVKEEALPADAHISEFTKLTKATERALESSIKTYEEQISGTDTRKQKKTISTPRIEALKAKRDVLKAELEALRAADQNLQDTKTFDRLMKSADELQGKLDRGEVRPPTKATRIEDELVVQARERLQNLRDQMQQARNATPEAQQAKLDSAIKAVEASIKAYDQKLTSGAISPTPSAPKVTSPILERLRAERDAMRKLVDTLRKGPPMDPEMAQLKALKARLAKANADIQERIARGDFSKKVRKEIDLSKDSEAVRLKAENDKWKREFEKRKFENQLATENVLEKGYRWTGEAAGAAKSSVGSFDVSAFARQSVIDTMAHPINAFRNLILSIQAMNEEKLGKINASIELRPNAQNGTYKAMGIQFTELGGKLSKMEEQFRSNWANKLPWVKWSGRQYTTFLNLARADAADRYIASSPVKPTKEQLNAFGDTVNIFTGRGDLGRFAGAADALALPFWSPRLYASRLQILLLRPLLQKNAKGVRRVIMKEYLRAASSGAAIVALGLLAGADIEWDKNSSDFLKLRWGNLRIDPWGGIQQWLVFLNRMITGNYKTTEGKLVDLGNPNAGPYDPTYVGTMGRMVRSKLNPVLGSYIDYRTGKDISGKPVDSLFEMSENYPFVEGAIPKAIMPLSIFNDDYAPIAEEFGYDKAAGAALLNMLGVGVQHYDEPGTNSR